MPVPSASTPKPSQTQSTSGLITICRLALWAFEVVLIHRIDEIEIFAERPPNRGLRSRSLLVFVEGPFRRVHLVDFFSASEHGDISREHLLLAVVVDLHTVVADGVRPDVVCSPSFSKTCWSILYALPAKPRRIKVDPDVHDVAAVAPFVAADQDR